MRNSPLHKYAIEQGWYDVDRVSNGKYLAKSDVDKVVGKSDMLPTHSGSHSNYDDEIKQRIDKVLSDNGVLVSDIPFLTEMQTKGLLNRVEQESTNVLLNWSGKLN